MRNWMKVRITATSALFILGSAFSPARAAADAVTSLADAVNATRAATLCPSLQQDAVVARVADMAMRNTHDYMYNRTAAVPFTDPIPALSANGYSATKGILFSGYGLTDEMALEGLLVTLRDKLADCSLSHLGVAALRDDERGFSLTSLVVTG
jgi:hypothetical protein